MIAKMSKVSLVGERTALKQVIDTLKNTGNFQITFYKSNANVTLDTADTTLKNQLTSQINTVSGLLTYFKADQRVLDLTYQNLKNVIKKQAKIDQLIKQLQDTRNTINNLNDQMRRNQETINLLMPFQDLPIAGNLIKNTRNVFVLAGIMPQREYTRFQNDLTLTNFICETYPTEHQKILVVLTGALTDLPIAETIYDYGFTAFPENQTFTQTPRQYLADLTIANQQIIAQIAAINLQQQPTIDQINLLKAYYDYLSNELDTLEILTATIQTKTCFVVHGWIPTKTAPQFTQLIQHVNKNIVVEIKEATATDTPPAAVRNSKIVAPYNSITAMYGAPGRTDLDPNPFVAFFYFLFFGMMFGDVAYGLLLSVITAVILIFKKPRGGTRQLMALFLMGGFSAAAWGLIFNSFFGMNLPNFLMPQTILNPIGADAILFFALSLYLGVIQIMFGTFLNVINLLRQKRYLDGSLKALPHFIFFVGLTLAFPALIRHLITLNYDFMDWFTPLMPPGLILTAIGFAGMVLFNGLGKNISGYLVGMFAGAYKIVSYFSDILSYARLFGVGLVGCVIAYVANYLFGMFASLGFIGIMIGVIIAVIFHAINIGLGLLSTYIHNARLQFVEFFGKFYEGSGTAFAPLGSKLRYTHIINNVGV